MKRQFLEAFLHNQIDSDDSSSSSSSQTSGISLIETDDELKGIKFREMHNRTKNYFESTVPSYSDKDFKRHFRMTRQSVANLCEMITLEKNVIGGWPEISKSKAVHVFLHYIANDNTFREVADKFDVTESACYDTVSTIAKKLSELTTQYIKLPKQQNVAFEENQGLPFANAAIDCTHMEIPRPKEHQEDYYSRNKYHSIIMQAVVDNEKVFRDIYVGEPGSLHDARVLKKSPLYHKLQTRNEIAPYYFLGDSAYPATLRWIVPPYRNNGNLTRQQISFNKRLSKKRVIVEQAFGLLKGRFRRLIRFNNKKIDLIVTLVVAAVVLHNLCIMWDDLDEDGEFYYEEQQENGEYIEEGLVRNTKRDEIFHMMFQ